MALTTSFVPGQDLLLRASWPVNGLETVQLTAKDYATQIPLAVSIVKTPLSWEWVIVTTGNQLVSLNLLTSLSGATSMVALVNTVAKEVLGKQARKPVCRCFNPPLRYLALYNGLLQVSFHEKDYPSCQQLLQLLDDLTPCDC